MIGERADPSASDSPRVLRWHRLTIGGALATGLLLAAHWLDPLVLQAVPENRASARDWARGLRALGFAPSWMVLALAFVMLDWKDNRWRRGTLVLFGAGISGLVAELAKKLIRRERPPGDNALHLLETWPGYAFRAFAEAPFSSTGLGMPSSHAAVAFGGMFMLCYLHPRASLVWIALAMGTGLTRILAEAHYLSDVVLAGIIAWATVRVLIVTDGRIARTRDARAMRRVEDANNRNRAEAGGRAEVSRRKRHEESV
jgi:membrane-associated phospholipid phosphatase